MSRLGYRRGVGIMLLDKRGRVFVGRRLDTPDAWQMPQGGIDEGEAPDAAAFRELKEEIGTNQADIIAETKGWLRYDLPKPLQGKVWGGGYRGQEQKWFAMQFRGADRDIRLDHHHHPEFDDWRWVEAKDLPKLIVPFKRKLYKALLEEFADLLCAR
jgi:putative (di)nucleoside polyphosphate hydrolase